MSDNDSNKIDVSELNGIMELSSKVNNESDIKFDTVESFAQNEYDEFFSPNTFNGKPHIIVRDEKAAELAGIKKIISKRSSLINKLDYSPV